jgi:DNA replication ATP-dependent helicase Dna2
VGTSTIMNTPTSAAAALQAILAFLTREQDALCKEYAEICAQSLYQRLESGHTLGPLRFLGTDADGLLRLHLEVNDSRYREGDYGYLGPAAVGEQAIGRGLPVKYVEFVQSTQTLVLERDIKQKQKGPTPSLRDQLYFDNRKVDLTNLYAKATTLALGCPAPSPLVRAIVLGDETSIDDAEWYRLYEFGKLAHFDESQCKAYAAQARWPLALVQGPPGTGKTRVLGEVAAGLLAAGQRLLVCAMTHRAVNNALNDCIKYAKVSAPIVKLGDRTQTKYLDERVERVEHRDELVGRLARSLAPVIVGTSVARAPGLDEKGVHFDVVIFDEAGQLTLPQVLCGAIAAPKAIFFGDHKQLPPIIQGDHPKEGWNLARSAFEILVDRHRAEPLTISYRLNAELARFPSQAFYGGLLKPSEQSAGYRLRVQFPPTHLLFGLLDPDHPLVWGNVEHRSRGTRCDEEAEIAAACIYAALEAGLQPKELAVISPFRAQNQAIRNRLRTYASKGFYKVEDVLVDTVERIQGQTREMVIVSLAVSDPAVLEQQAQFIFCPNRLNVSITRATAKCIVLGSPMLLGPPSRDEAVLEGAQMLQQLVSFAHRVEVPVLSTGLSSGKTQAARKPHTGSSRRWWANPRAQLLKGR